MNKYMLLFLVACIVIGLWAPTQKRMGRVILLLTACIVVFFFLSPSHL
jgi:hypothetical protein